MKLTRRGKIVVAIAALIALYGMYELVTHVWWVGDHYCFGDIMTCEFPK
jgi:hypothetical protein